MGINSSLQVQILKYESMILAGKEVRFFNQVLALNIKTEFLLPNSLIKTFF